MTWSAWHALHSPGGEFDKKVGNPPNSKKIRWPTENAKVCKNFVKVSKNWMQNLGSKIIFAKLAVNPTLLRLSTTFLVFGSEIRKSSFHVVWYRCIEIFEVFHEVPFLSTIRSSEVTMQV